MATISNKYERGKIYKIITSNSNDVYIGSTILSLKRRLQKHRSMYKNRGHYISSSIILRQGGYKIELIKDFPCNSKKELEREEGKYQREMDCVNKCIAGRGVKERGREYYKKKREEIKIKKKKYRKDNEMRIKQKYDCECGGKFTHDHKTQHLKTKKHNKFLAIKK